MNRKYVIFLLLGSIFFGNTELDQSNSQSSEILGTILSGYNKDISFTLDASNSKTKFLMNVSMLHLEDGPIVAKIFAECMEPEEVEGMHVWIWDYSDGDNQIWITRPDSGELIDITGKDFMLPIDITSIQLDSSILEQFHTTVDTVDYNGVESYLIDFYKIRKTRKIGPMMKAWIGISDNQILKIQKLSRKGKLIGETLFKEYFKDFPKKVIINEIKNKDEITINISNYKESPFEDLKIFEPLDKNSEK